MREAVVSVEEYTRAILNILEDFSSEKSRLESVQKAILNILEDFDLEKGKVEAANYALSRSNAELEQFAYLASHDLQEPLRMVSSYVQLFAKRYEGQVDEKAQRYIRYAVEGAERMQTLISALLEYSRVGRQTQAGPVDAESALDQALSNLRPSLEESQAQVTRVPLPKVVAEHGQLVQVFQNLLGNALKFARREEPPQVHVGAILKGNQVLFSVRDNGIGIDPQFQERIFVIFQRLHSRSEYPGTGIGLSICKKVVERFGGQIWVESDLGRGATFFFTLPKADRNEPVATR